MLAPDSAHVTNITVDPLQQRSGVGTRLLLALARDAIAMAAPTLTLEVRVGNVAALQLYERFGFTPAGIRKRYYEGRDDAIVMWAHDIGQPAPTASRAIGRPDSRHHRVGGRIGMDHAEVDISLRVAPLRPVDASTVVLGIETSCDETAAAVLATGGWLSVVVSPGRRPPRVRRRRARARRARHIERFCPVIGRRSPRPASRSTTSTPSPRPTGPGWSASLLVGLGRQGDRVARGCPFVASITSRATC